MDDYNSPVSRLRVRSRSIYAEDEAGGRVRFSGTMDLIASPRGTDRVWALREASRELRELLPAKLF